MNQNKNFKQIAIRIFLFVLFIGYYGSMNLFHHAHFIDGKWMEHSHPYKNTKSHTHTSAAFHYINQLNQSNWEDTSRTVNLSTPSVSVTKTTFNYCLSHRLSERYNRIQLRAPPHFI